MQRRSDVVGKRAVAATVLFILLLSAGCIGRDPDSKSFMGMRLSTSDCDAEFSRDADRMQCYYTVAISTAYLCGVRVSPSSTMGCPGVSSSTVPCEALSICNQIWLKWADSGKDMRRKAEMMSNHCFYDVAKITRNSDTCGFILQHDDVGTQLFGDAATRDMCYREVDGLARATPEMYYCNNPDNLCSIVFVLPLLLALAIARRGP